MFTILLYTPNTLVDLNMNTIPTPFPRRMKTIKVESRVWDTLRHLKGENDSFNDVIRELLQERSQSVGDSNLKAIQYKRKVGFFTLAYGESIAFEYEYNDVKSNKEDFILDLKIKKIFFRKQVLSPSTFFGVDNIHKHYSRFFMEVYIGALSLALYREFRIKVLHELSIGYYRQLYYDGNLSEESFHADIEEPLRLSEVEIPPEAWKQRIQKSLAAKFQKEQGITFK
ncbi:hypothetical protein HYW21_01460 [Candidatus Woesearchaeota archaeon]|nr:hypothetical protein [Candidatus Woesearchaeota archaeon]